jgi:hypothetical protein
VANGVTNDPKTGILCLILKIMKTPTKHQAKKKGTDGDQLQESRHKQDNEK